MIGVPLDLQIIARRMTEPLTRLNKNSKSSNSKDLLFLFHFAESPIFFAKNKFLR